MKVWRTRRSRGRRQERGRNTGNGLEAIGVGEIREGGGDGVVGGCVEEVQALRRRFKVPEGATDAIVADGQHARLVQSINVPQRLVQQRALLGQGHAEAVEEGDAGGEADSTIVALEQGVNVVPLQATLCGCVVGEAQARRIDACLVCLVRRTRVTLGLPITVVLVLVRKKF